MKIEELINELQKYPKGTEVSINIAGSAEAYNHPTRDWNYYRYEADATELRFYYREPATDLTSGTLQIQNVKEIDIELEP